MRELLWQRRTQSMRAAWASIITDHRMEIPDMVRLYCLYMCIPIATADVERGFSEHLATKTKVRNRLLAPTLDAILRIKGWVRGMADGSPLRGQVLYTVLSTFVAGADLLRHAVTLYTTKAGDASLRAATLHLRTTGLPDAAYDKLFDTDSDAGSDIDALGGLDLPSEHDADDAEFAAQSVRTVAAVTRPVRAAAAGVHAAIAAEQEMDDWDV